MILEILLQLIIAAALLALGLLASRSEEPSPPGS